MSSLLSLSLDEKRQAVYSSLLRYSSEVVPLRERVLDRVVLGALIGSSESEPFRLGRIQLNLKFGSNAPEIRTETIQEALRRLIKDEKAVSTELKKRHAYHLTNSGQEELSRLIVSADALFTVVLDNMLRDADVPQDVGRSVCRKFIFECFARYGQIIAKNVTGRISHDTLMKSLDTRSAFAAAIEGKTLSEAAIQALHARCQLFLRSPNSDDEKLKFYLTQGYYFAQLLGLDDSGFNPLNDHAFANAVFYLDTNVVIVGLLYESDQASLFDEMVSIAERLGIELRVTRATINEARRVATDRLPILRAVADIIPDELAEHTDDQFVLAYLEARTEDAVLRPETFLRSFEELPTTLKERWKVTIDDRTEEEIINDRDFTHIANIFGEAAKATRGWSKSPSVLEHDVAHYALINDERTHNPKTWFLTRDRSLAQAAITLAEQQSVYCFSLVGFLQSISPFLTTTRESTFVDVFSAMLSEQVFPPEPIFDATELALMAEYHQDVLATPAEQLLRAFDYVKSKTLLGRPYRRADIPEVSLELRKFLSSSREEQLRALEIERARVVSEKNAEEELRKAAELRASGRDAEIRRLEEAQATLRQDLSNVNSALESQKITMARERMRRRAAYMLAGFISAFFIWYQTGEICARITSVAPQLSAWDTACTVIIRSVGCLVFSIPGFLFLRSTVWPETIKTGLSVVIILAALGSSQLVEEQTASTLANYIEIASFVVVLALALGLLNPRNKKEGD